MYNKLMIIIAKDYEILRKIKKDIKMLYAIGNEILKNERNLKVAISYERFDEAIKIRVRK